MKQVEIPGLFGNLLPEPDPIVDDFAARVPGSSRSKVVHLFLVESEFLSVRAYCGGTEAGPGFVERTDDDVTCAACRRAIEGD